MKALLMTTAMVALLSSPALAQSESQPMDSAPVQQPVPLQPDQPLDEEAAGKTDVVPASDIAFIIEQDDSESLASEWIGKMVYGADDERIGDINDLLLSEDGSIRGVILGVGGFLGIGEKSVAVEIDAVQVRPDTETGETTLHLPLTREQLENAPDFMTLASVRAAEEAARQQALQPAPAPAPVTPQ